MQFLQKKWVYPCIITILISLAVFTMSFVIQIWQSNPHWVSDVPNHAQFILDFTKKGHFPAYSLWYVLVALFSGFSAHFTTISYVSIILLSLLMGLKYFISYEILKADSSSHFKHLKSITFILLFVMPILSFYTVSQYPNQFIVNRFHVYLGNIAANQWHNSTLILAMPVNLLLFFYSVKQINSERFSCFLIMSVYGVLSILCKPSYALAFIPVFCFTLFIINIQRRHYLEAFIKPAIIAIPAILAVTYQWYYTFLDNNLFKHPTKTVIAPLLVWQTYSPHIFLSLLLSIAFPLAILVFYFKKMDKFLLLSWLTFLVALMIFSLLAEYPNYMSANYAWGSIAATYILFLFSVKILLNQPLDWKAKVSYGILGLHFLSGVFLLCSFFIKKTPLIL